MIFQAKRISSVWGRPLPVALTLTTVLLLLVVVLAPALAAGGAPQPEAPSPRNVTATSVYLQGAVNTRGHATHWRYEYATSETGEFHTVPGGEGTITLEELEASRKVEEGPEAGPFPPVSVRFTGLDPGSTYYVRLFAESEPEPGVVEHATSPIASFQTVGPPSATTFAVHALHGEATRLMGSTTAASDTLEEEQTIAIGGTPTGGTFALAFEGKRTGATGVGDLLGSGAATGTGDFSLAYAYGVTTKGSNVVTNVTTEAGVLVVGQTIIEGPKDTPRFPVGTTIVSVGEGTLTLSAAANTTNSSLAFEAGSADVTNVSTSSGSFTVGLGITGSNIPPGTTIAAVGAGTITLSQMPTTEGGRSKVFTNVPLTAGSDTISNISTSTGAFVAGEEISGAGIPAGTTITEVRDAPGEVDTMTLSANTTTAGTGVALTAGLPYNADQSTVTRALNALLDKQAVSVQGPVGGPYTVLFLAPGVNEPQIAGDGSSLSPVEPVTVTTTTEGGQVSYEPHYYFEYVSSKQFEEDEWTHASSAPPVAGSGIVGEDIPGLRAGETYRYRLVETSSFPGSAVVRGAAETLAVPARTVATESGGCPNEEFRGGESAVLPACRAYEQVTPVDKEGSQEPFLYSSSGIVSSTWAGEDGDHFALENSGVNWGAGVHAGQSPYFFSRDPEKGWLMTGAASQPETGARNLINLAFNADLTDFAFETGLQTSAVDESKEVEVKSGPPGGPYTTIATLPRNDHLIEAVAGASSDLSKLILQSEDRTLSGSATGTKSGEDLYEYSGGELSQLNVNSEGGKLGVCGASLPNRSTIGGEDQDRSGAISSGGARVFFEAVPGSKCSEASHLYMREEGAKTVDIGAYRFLAANVNGSKLVLIRQTGEASELFLYETETATAHLLFTVDSHGGEARFMVSSNLTAIYFVAQEQMPGTEAPAPSPETADAISLVTNIYRYDISAEKLSFVAQAEDEDNLEFQVSSDGRYLYFDSRHVAGLPGGAMVPTGGETYAKYPPVPNYTYQVYRYDGVQNTIECASCASPFAPEPKLDSGFNEEAFVHGGGPRRTFVSGDGSRAFFESTAALVPSDIDGEVVPEIGNGEFANLNARSPSSDVYEWRANGVDGCGQAQGCLALISSGRGGYLTILLGSAEEGRDVFFYTSSQLVAQDRDTAGDIYDARIGGGFPPPAPPPVECEGDACSTPAMAPNDGTPSSLTFTGLGNLVTLPAAQVKPTAKKPVRCAKGKVRAHGKCIKLKAKAKRSKKFTSRKGSK